MTLHKIKKGLNLPITGAPEQVVQDADTPRHVALMAADYPGLKPQMRVAQGDKVRRGQLLFEDKKQAGVHYTAPASGTVAAINRGAKRAFQSLVIQLDSGEASGRPDQVDFPAYTGQHPSSLNRQQVRELLIESGLWTALRARPFGCVADPESVPRSVFVTAMDTEPLAPDHDVLIEGSESDLERGLLALAKLTDGNVFVCKAPGSKVSAPAGSQFRVEEFAGPHPAGTAGLHIHILDPVNRNKLVWHIGLADVIAIGRLFDSGQIDATRIVSLAGPAVNRPRLLRTRIGAAIGDLTAGELVGGEVRTISGSVLSGRKAEGEVHGYLGRFHRQISAIRENRERELLGWLAPGLNMFSILPVFVSALMPRKKFQFTSSTYGSHRAIIPIGMFERVVPLDLQPTFLLKALAVGDIETAEQLGCLELVEEDLALCTFVDPGKTQYGPLLRDTLTVIEKEG